MEEILQKLKSRKLWLAVAGMCTGVALTFGVDAGDLQTVAGAVTTLVSAVVYILAEGKVDAVAMEGAAEKVRDAAETLTEQER